MNSPLKHFADLRDPRVERTREHLLEEILLIAIAASGRAQRLGIDLALPAAGFRAGVASEDQRRSLVAASVPRTASGHDQIANTSSVLVRETSLSITLGLLSISIALRLGFTST